MVNLLKIIENCTNLRVMSTSRTPVPRNQSGIEYSYKTLSDNAIKEVIRLDLIIVTSRLEQGEKAIKDIKKELLKAGDGSKVMDFLKVEFAPSGVIEKPDMNTVYSFLSLLITKRSEV
ncbi:TPA: hypothetical protein K8M95_001043 [Clostridium perfringens]|uniref:hypothetical protein n=1 Tax=Clostridium perfringens TaxID=1502 RepID=UPI001CAD7884|nr:hypothetical protein [Clostridium perfringens]MDK0658185.1 hypothetical protein [Clostridium perfringens]MDM0661856.1 hypothetical protein [Clostridium perfringens]HBI6221937.1 hypothetical protein [Clostridium perfringens]HBI7059922.1 hypothetical protein [Clostridium perfringens]HBI7063906.1 hypothetical protein [Clostridium perfringens]